MAREAQPIEVPESPRGEPWDTYRDRYDKWYAAVMEEHAPNKDPDAKDLKGSLLQWPRADGYACYVVVRHSPLTVSHLPIGDAWTVEPALIRGLTIQDVRTQVRQRQRWNELFRRRDQEGGCRMMRKYVILFENGGSGRAEEFVCLATDQENALDQLLTRYGDDAGTILDVDEGYERLQHVEDAKVGMVIRLNDGGRGGIDGAFLDAMITAVDPDSFTYTRPFLRRRSDFKGGGLESNSEIGNFRSQHIPVGGIEVLGVL